MEKYGRAGQTTVDNTVWRMCFACWITKAIDTLFCHCNNGYTNAPPYYVVGTLCVLFVPTVTIINQFIVWFVLILLGNLL